MPSFILPGQPRVVPLRLRYLVFERDGFRCRSCGLTAAQARLQVDHVRPVAEGGETEIGNLQTLCQDCNVGKGAWMPTEKTPDAQARSIGHARIDASVLGLKSCEWPPVVMFNNRMYGRRSDPKLWHDGDILSVTYHNLFGETLEVMND